MLKLFKVLHEALARPGCKGQSIVQLDTALWPCLMPRVVHVMRRLAHCLPLMEVRQRPALSSGRDEAMHCGNTEGLGTRAGTGGPAGGSAGLKA